MNFLDPDLFLIPFGMLPWQLILGKICKLTFIQHAGIRKGFRYRNSAFEVIKGAIFATLCNYGGWPLVIVPAVVGPGVRVALWVSSLRCVHGCTSCWRIYLLVVLLAAEVWTAVTGASGASCGGLSWLEVPARPGMYFMFPGIYGRGCRHTINTCTVRPGSFR